MVLQTHLIDYNRAHYQVGICALDANKQKDAQNKGPLYAVLFLMDAGFVSYSSIFYSPYADTRVIEVWVNTVICLHKKLCNVVEFYLHFFYGLA